MKNRTVIKKFYSPNEASEALGIGRTRVFNLIKSGELRSTKYGTTRLIPVEAVDEFAARLMDAA